MSGERHADSGVDQSLEGMSSLDPRRILWTVHNMSDATLT